MGFSPLTEGVVGGRSEHEASSNGYYIPGTKNISEIIVHHMAGFTINACEGEFKKSTRGATSTYGIGPLYSEDWATPYDDDSEGTAHLWGFADETWVAWASSNGAADSRGISVEIADSLRSGSYPQCVDPRIKNSCLRLLSNLMADIATRWEKTNIVWIGNRDESLTYTPKDTEIIVRVHRFYGNTTCPGGWLIGEDGYTFPNGFTLDNITAETPLAWVVKRANGLIGGTGRINYVSFTPRDGIDKYPKKDDTYAKCYRRTDAGGWSSCCPGQDNPDNTPLDPGRYLNVLSNCVGYACGRFNEIFYEVEKKYAELNPSVGDSYVEPPTAGRAFKYSLFNGDPNTFVSRANNYAEIEVSAIPHPGDIVVYTGHVAVVERVIDNETIDISESGYQSWKEYSTLFFGVARLKKVSGGWYVDPSQGCYQKGVYSHRAPANETPWLTPASYTFLGFITNKNLQAKLNYISDPRRPATYHGGTTVIAVDRKKQVWNRLQEDLGAEVPFSDALKCVVFGSMLVRSDLSASALDPLSVAGKAYTPTTYTTKVESGEYKYSTYTKGKESFVHDNSGYGLLLWNTPADKEGIYNNGKIDSFEHQLDYAVKRVREVLETHPSLDLSPSLEITTILFLQYVLNIPSTSITQDMFVSYAEKARTVYKQYVGIYVEQDLAAYYNLLVSGVMRCSLRRINIDGLIPGTVSYVPFENERGTTTRQDTGQEYAFKNSHELSIEVNSSQLSKEGKYLVDTISITVDPEYSAIETELPTVRKLEEGENEYWIYCHLSYGQEGEEDDLYSAYKLTINLTVNRTPYISTISIEKGDSTNAYEIVPITKTYRRMTVVVDCDNPNPYACCTYADDAALMQKDGELDWDEFFGHYPVLFKDGVEIVKLDPNDFSKDIDGVSVDTTSGEEGDVMIKFPRRGVRINKVGNKIYVSMTDNPDDPTYTYFAHNRNDQAYPAFYLGAYRGCNLKCQDNYTIASPYTRKDKLRSLSGRYPEIPPIANRRYRFEDYVEMCRNNGEGYDLQGYYQTLYLQVMYVLKYGNLNSQATIGMGIVDIDTPPGKTDNTYSKTGATNTYGMDNEHSPYKTDPSKHMKLFGLEDLWGFRWQLISGMRTGTFFSVPTDGSPLSPPEDIKNGEAIGDPAYPVSSSSGYVYTSYDLGETEWQDNMGFNAVNTSYMKVPFGTDDYGFLPAESGGSYSTYFCDVPYLKFGAESLGYRCIFGCRWHDRNACGIFTTSLNTGIYWYSLGALAIYPSWESGKFYTAKDPGSLLKAKPDDWGNPDYYTMTQISTSTNAEDYRMTGRLMYL